MDRWKAVSRLNGSNTNKVSYFSDLSKTCFPHVHFVLVLKSFDAKIKLHCSDTEIHALFLPVGKEVNKRCVCYIT